jgi:hypothetical protein
MIKPHEKGRVNRGPFCFSGYEQASINHRLQPIFRYYYLRNTKAQLHCYIVLSRTTSLRFFIRNKS